MNEVCRDWKFHRDDVLKEVFEMCDKDGDEKLAGEAFFHLDRPNLLILFEIV